METRDTLWRARPYFCTSTCSGSLGAVLCYLFLRTLMGGHNVGTDSSCNRHSHDITHRTLAISPHRETKVRDRSKKDIQSGKASKKLPMISSSWAQWALSNTVKNSIHFPRHTRAAGRYSCIKLLKSCLHLAPCCSAAQIQQVHFLSMTSVLAGEGRQHCNIHRCSCCKACAQKAECTKREVPFVHSFGSREPH